MTRTDRRMILGILSDSHGRPVTTRNAVRSLINRGAQTLIHLGDLGDESVIDELVGYDSHIVFGNCDWETAALSRHAQVMGIQVDHPMGLLQVAGKRIAFTHGHLVQLLDQAMQESVDYLLHGHTHEVRDERVKGTRVINPGALFRAKRYTAALLDPAIDSLEFIEIASGDSTIAS